MIKVTETSIIIDRKALFDWVTGEDQRVKEADASGTETASDLKDTGSLTDASEPQSSSVEHKSEPETSVDVGKGVDLFEDKHGIGGALQDAEGGSKKMQEMKKWMTDNKFSYRNFCLYLYKLEMIGGWKLKKPLIGTTQKGEPSLFKVATRYYSFWKSQQGEVAQDYKQFLRGQVEGIGFTIEQAAEILDGEVIDPSELPKGTEVSP
jgi:hypothetical protein